MPISTIYSVPGASADAASKEAPVVAPTSLALAPVMLTVYNRRSDAAPAQLAFFKRNSAGADEVLLAWKVIRCAVGQHAHVVLPFDQQVGVFDPHGQHAGSFNAVAGDLFRASTSADGQPLLEREAARGALAANMVGVRNGTAALALDVVLYKDGRPLCQHKGLAPGAVATFEVLPYLHVGLCPGVAEGAPLDAASVAGATRISLLGLKSADLELSGSGAGEMKLLNQRFS